ncbi:MAG: hypothetical protein ACU0C9_08735 [Paracoccaceae bacterium]
MNRIAPHLPVMTDDRDANIFSVTEPYLIPRAQMMPLDLLTDIPFVSANIYEQFPEFLIADRRDPLAVQHSQRMTHKIRVLKAPIKFNAPGRSAIDGVAFDQNFSARAWAGGNMEMTLGVSKPGRSPGTCTARPMTTRFEYAADERPGQRQRPGQGTSLIAQALGQPHQADGLSPIAKRVRSKRAIGQINRVLP